MRLIDADKLPKYTGYALSAAEVAMAVESAPTVDPVKHGRWLSVKLLDDEADFEEVDGAECSMCGGTFSSEYWAKTYFKYCPYCGAYMMAEVSE